MWQGELREPGIAITAGHQIEDHDEQVLGDGAEDAQGDVGFVIGICPHEDAECGLGYLGCVLMAIEQRSTDEAAHCCVKFADQPDGSLCHEAILISIAGQPLGYVRVGGQRRGVLYRARALRAVWPSVS